MQTSYYNSNSTHSRYSVVDSNWVAVYGGIDPATSTPAELAAAGFYTYSNSENGIDGLTTEVTASAWVISGTSAQLVPTTAARPLADVKELAISTLSDELNLALTTQQATYNFPVIRLIVEASKTQANRDASIQAEFNSLNTMMTDYATNVTAINAATTVDEVVAIVRP